MSRRPIRCVYYSEHEAKHVVKTTSGTYSGTSVANSVYHLQRDHYGAALVEVVDAHRGVLHAVIKRSVRRTEILYKHSLTFPKE